MVDERQLPVVGVIEDDAAARTALGRLLEASGFEPALFDSAETFMASPRGRNWLCLIVDVQLTGMSGLELQRQLRADGCGVPVIVITANRTDTVREKAEQAGCATVLWKPFSGDTILSLLTSIARGGGTGPKSTCTNVQ
jgi:FixJ family two-component response regulator